MNIYQQQLTAKEQELMERVCHFHHKVGITKICFNNIWARIRLELDDNPCTDQDFLDINDLRSTFLSLESERNQIVTTNYPENHPVFNRLSIIDSLINSIRKVLKMGGVVKSFPLGAFKVKEEIRATAIVRNIPPTIYLYIFNINATALAEQTSREYILIKTFIHEMFHAWNFFACEEKERAVREIDEAMVECETLCFLKHISQKDNEFKPILDWAERSIWEKKTAIGRVAAYGFGHYLYSMSKLNGTKHILENYPYKSGVINENSNIVVQARKKLETIYPFGEESEVFDIIYKICCPKVIAHLIKEGEVYDLVREEDEPHYEEYFREINIKGTYLNKSLRFIYDKDAYNIEFRFARKWWPLYDNVLFKEVVLFRDFVFAVPQSGQSEQNNIILCLRHIKRNLSLCNNDMSLFKQIINSNILRTDGHIINGRNEIRITEFLRVEQNERYNYFSYCHHKTRDLFFENSFDGCAIPKCDYGEWRFRAIERNICYLFDEHRTIQKRENAPTFFVNAKESNAPAAQFRLAEYYRHGRWVVRNLAKAVEWYDKAAGQGYKDAEYVLGEIYFYGYGVEKNKDRAIELFKRAAKSGHSKAKDILSLIAKDGEPMLEGWNQLEEGKELYAYGERYRTGWQVFKDENKAIDYYLKAINKGCLEAICRLKELAHKGNVNARIALGKMYENGKGVERNIIEAIELYRKALKKDHAGAADALKQLVEKGGEEGEKALDCLCKLAQQTNTLATERLIRLAKDGNVEAQYAYGMLLQKIRRYEDAKDWLFKAMLRGHTKAKEAYRSLASKNNES